MKLGVVGKGGTGKTTLSTLVALAYLGRGKRVLAVDTDSNPNLALSLGLDEAMANAAPLVPRSLVVGSGPGGMSPSKLIADYGLCTPAGVTLLHAMRVDQAGSGCTCASHSSVRSLLAAAIEEEADLTLVDMEAGLEHLARSGGTLAHADVLLIVMEPTRKSILTAARTMALAEELGILRMAGVATRHTCLRTEPSSPRSVPSTACLSPASYPTNPRSSRPTARAPGSTSPRARCTTPSRPSSTSSSPLTPSVPPCSRRSSESSAAWPS